MSGKKKEEIITPVVTRDPRFLAGRSLVQTGLAHEGAIDIFAILVEEARSKYGEESIETAPAYYEYGNALLRAASKLGDEEQEGQDEIAVAPADPREAAATAAEKRFKNAEETKSERKEDAKPAATERSKEQSEAGKDEAGDDGDEKEEDNEDEIEEGNDIDLALEMMETAFSIIEEYRDSETNTPKTYLGWAVEQLPRVLLGIGDTLSSLDRHSDAADAYARALALRQEKLNEFCKEDLTMEHLQAQRRACEATILICEELLACPPGEDVVATETHSLIVKASERVEYVRGYYDKARDALQDTVFLMANLAARNIDVEVEKEDVCFVSTMVMGVGTALAEIDEKEAEERVAPIKKKQKI